MRMREKATQIKKIIYIGSLGLWAQRPGRRLFGFQYFFQDLSKVYARAEVKLRIYFMWPNSVIENIPILQILSGTFASKSYGSSLYCSELLKPALEFQNRSTDFPWTDFFRLKLRTPNLYKR